MKSPSSWRPRSTRCRLDAIEGMLQQLSEQGERQFEHIDRHLRQLVEQGNMIMATLQDIQQAVTDEKTVEDSVLALLTQVEQMLKDAIAANDPAAMQAIVDQIAANKQAMADAVAQNAPANP